MIEVLIDHKNGLKLTSQSDDVIGDF